MITVDFFTWAKLKPPSAVIVPPSDMVIAQISPPTKCARSIGSACWPNHIVLTGGGSLQVAVGCVRSRPLRLFDSRFAQKTSLRMQVWGFQMSLDPQTSSEKCRKFPIYISMTYGKFCLHIFCVRRYTRESGAGAGFS
jgi:hypothetical protein